MYAKSILQIIVLAFSLQSSLCANCLYAKRHYPKNYTVEVSQEALTTLTTSVYSTHSTKIAALIHEAADNLWFLPLRVFLHAGAYSVEPFPGAHKEAKRWQVVCKRGAALCVCALTFMPALSSLISGTCIRFFEHCYRPFLSYFVSPNPTQERISLTKKHPLHLATFNVALTPSSLNIKMDLRPPRVRAKELAKSIAHDPLKADILVLEEAWHEGALKILCRELQSHYPYILHNIAPHISGLSSGIAVFSKYPIIDVKFFRFDNMISLDALPPRGVLRLLYETEKGHLFIYGGIHTQAYDTKKCVLARKQQIDALKQFMREDAALFPDTLQIAMGDFNLSFLAIEAKTLQELACDFVDLFALDHHPISGLRTRAEPIFLDSDNRRMGLEFAEPCASWYDGPFTKDFSWGTPQWMEEQRAVNARFDYIVVPKNSPLTGHIEIRRIVMETRQQSPSSDHLPVHGLIWRE